ncbi:hypothetical protein [Metallosphaera hakonensis]|uniref:hypothetical protein n=1 Tax=Metallosphaera hakonensis TaxID=79601 RepID=UPI0011B2595B|nr:hypothetical protein [Metallosphaera hakonensis]QIJ32943.1 hypothetical protein DFR87_13175 [Metallosphaera hakonensis JCM 8857 = DSM 7519]
MWSLLRWQKSNVTATISFVRGKACGASYPKDRSDPTSVILQPDYLTKQRRIACTYLAQDASVTLTRKWLSLRNSVLSRLLIK